MNTNLLLNPGEEPQANGKMPPSRRRLLGWLVAAINFAIAAVVVGPVLGFIGSPLRRKSRTRWIPVLPEEELKAGETKEVAFVLTILDGYAEVDRKYTVFLHRYPDRVVAFDPACTHLGCRIKWVGDKDRYFCPCHGGVFDPNGNVVSGPPPKPLVQHSVKVEGGKIWVEKSV